MAGKDADEIDGWEIGDHDANIRIPNGELESLDETLLLEETSMHVIGNFRASAKAMTTFPFTSAAEHIS